MKASIDIGTNTTLLLVADKNGPSLNILEEQQRIPRLGAGVDDSKALSKAAMERVVESLREFLEIINNKYPEVDDIYVTATSAVRDAKNKAVFIDRVEHETGLQIRVLSGVEEAEYTFLGAKSMLGDLEGQQMVIDIGGGSTEIAYGGKQLQDRYSYDMGCVRFTERFLKNDPPTELQIRHCKDAVKEMLEEYEFTIPNQTTLIGVAGTVTSLTFIDLGLSSYDAEVLSGRIITNEGLQEYIKIFSGYRSKALEQKYPSVMKGRADIFMAGLLILDGFMNEYNFEELITSTGGIRHGAILANKEK
ncbi:hypothetical protein CK503_00305 [Aliifodinibius salipaludis]|uniref:Ppx/GppA phosphatase N-terminal domain-containing protein n=1 Tax=Fodinibius salipaludis TaxID=2032627 RepID=A0A2A2GFJ4_9BACT|nr:Ppx/GppA phosphatase family protein [Aliifodinibius salipaludis]PAU95542.1 hypothetical protein CK503_00305 [Aliifodinibius salipaludis]